ncbi:MAG: class 1 fructose-bisphosphatase [Roseinatronobacter sp.]
MTSRIKTIPSLPLTLPSDRRDPGSDLDAALRLQAGSDPMRQALARLIGEIAQASIPLALRLAQGNLPGDPDAGVGRNVSGDRQKALDMAAHAHFLKIFAGLSVAHVLSEEADEVVLLDPEGLFDVAMDPIDGSGSIGIGAPLGALFCIFPRGETFLRSGRDILAASYVSFGHSLDFGFSLGDGVTIATCDPVTRVFHIDTLRVQLPESSSAIAYNASNLRHWPAGLQHLIRDLERGRTGPLGRDFNMRWIAAAVGDLHRILRKGGLFFYPADARSGYEAGLLRLAYEAFPIAFLIEQAGGVATDGRIPILERVPETLHAKVPLVFGTRREAALYATYTASVSDAP